MKRRSRYSNAVEHQVFGLTWAYFGRDSMPRRNRIKMWPDVIGEHMNYIWLNGLPEKLKNFSPQSNSAENNSLVLLIKTIFRHMAGLDEYWHLKTLSHNFLVNVMTAKITKQLSLLVHPSKICLIWLYRNILCMGVKALNNKITTEMTLNHKIFLTWPLNHSIQLLEKLPSLFR